VFIVARSKPESSPKEVARLFPFARRTNIVVVGRKKMMHLRGGIEFVLVSTDISANSIKEIRKNLPGTPVAQRYSSEEFLQYFDKENTKMIGFRRSDLASSILSELDDYVLVAPPWDNIKKTDDDGD
jgi:hypothetical protein